MQHACLLYTLMYANIKERKCLGSYRSGTKSGYSVGVAHVHMHICNLKKLILSKDEKERDSSLKCRFCQMKTLLIIFVLYRPL